MSNQTIIFTIQGFVHPDTIVNYIMSKSKGNDGLGDIKVINRFGNEEKLKLLEERLIKG